MKRKQCAVFIVAVLLLTACGEGVTGQSRLAQLRERKSIIQNYILPAATAACGQMAGNRARTEAMLARAQIRYAEGLALAQEEAGATLTPEENRQIDGVLDQVDPHSLANLLITQLEDVRDSKDAASLDLGIASQILEAIESMPALVTINAVDLAMRQYAADLRDPNSSDLLFSKGVLKTARLVAEHNSQKRGYAPADLLPIFTSGYRIGESFFAGETPSSELLSIGK